MQSVGGSSKAEGSVNSVKSVGDSHSLIRAIRVRSSQGYVFGLRVPVRRSSAHQTWQKPVRICSILGAVLRGGNRNGNVRSSCLVYSITIVIVRLLNDFLYLDSHFSHFIHRLKC